jgi:hypothetical protein
VLRRVLHTTVVAAGIVFAQAGAANAYPWPLRPFDVPHPVRSVLGDPRTMFVRDAAMPAGGPGTFSFHNGVDIDAPSGTPVYPVVSGSVDAVIGRVGVLVRSTRGRLFLYYHLRPDVHKGEQVIAERTVLGRVAIWADELHFSEFDRGRIANPLLRGHLTPYRDTTKPTVAYIQFRDPRGDQLSALDLHGRVEIVANAYDTPVPAARERGRRYKVSGYVRDRFSVVPAAVSWTLFRWRGGTVVPERTVVDFRRRFLPPRRSFWRIYARGTYANRPEFGQRFYKNMPGVFLFRLTPAFLNTERLRDGLYIVKVTATDVRGNTGSLSARFMIQNHHGA